jgi:hypothetical protein
MIGPCGLRWALASPDSRQHFEPDHGAGAKIHDRLVVRDDALQQLLEIGRLHGVTRMARTCLKKPAKAD